MGGPFAELIDRHGARFLAFLRAETSSDQAAGSWFGETFRLMAKERADLETEIDAEVLLYRHALRVKMRVDVPGPDPHGDLARMLEGVPTDDRLAFVLLEASGLRIDRVANALRRPEPRLKEALAQALVTMTRAAVPELAPAPDDATSDAMVAMAVLGVLESDDRRIVDADPTAAPRRAAMEHVLAMFRDLLPPCEPPPALLTRIEAAIEKSLQADPDFAPARPRRSAGRVTAFAIAAVLALGGGGLALVQLRGDAEAPETIVEEATEDPAESKPAPRTEPIEALPAVEVAAQGPAAPVDPRLEKATAHARRHRCKKAAHLFAKLVGEQPAHAAAAKTALAPCRGWLKKHRRDPKLAALR